MTHDDEKVADLCDLLMEEDKADASVELACALAELLRKAHLAALYQEGPRDMN